MRSPERGAGLVASVAGVAVFLALLTVAVQVAVTLHHTTVVTAAAYDAARLVAAAGGAADPARRAAAEEHARSLLGAGDDVRFEWGTGDPDVVTLRVVTEPPRVVLPVVDGALGLDVIDRTVTVRVEREQG